MKVPVIAGVIDRRILINYRVEPDALAKLLPAPFRPKLVRGYGVAGVCLIRLKHVRPPHVPRLLGLTSENAAHRIAVEWDEGGVTREGVYIPRRDSSSWLNTLAGGRLFPGEHHLASFRVTELGDRLRVRVSSFDRRTRIEVDAQSASFLPRRSLFTSLADASAFFEGGAVGYSASRAGRLDGLELRTLGWRVEPLAVTSLASSYFDDPCRFPKGTAEFDCALMMRGVEHEWHAREPICCAAGAVDVAMPVPVEARPREEAAASRA